MEILTLSVVWGLMFGAVFIGYGLRVWETKQDLAREYARAETRMEARADFLANQRLDVALRAMKKGPKPVA